MRIKISHIFLMFLVIICSSLIFSQSPYYRYNSNQSLSINDYLVFDYESKLSTDFIRMDSLCLASVQGTSSKFLFQYNENDKMTEWLILDNFGSGWDNSLKNNLFYDNQHNLITEINLGWYINDWDSLSRFNYSYEMGLLSQSVHQVYNNNYWENLSRSNYLYDQNQNLTNHLIERWINNNWQNWLLSTSYYSLQNKRDSILFQTWVNNGWQDDKKTVFYYSENQIDLDSLVVKTWDGLSWVNSWKREIVNDINHNQAEQLEKIWDGSEWLNQIRRFFTYNEYNFIESAHCEIWQYNLWLSGDGDIFFRNPDGFSIAFITNAISAYYSIFTQTEIIDYSLSQNYPNPFNPSTLIEYKIPESNFVKIKVYDILGKEKATLVDEFKSKGDYKVRFYANNLPSGVYIYRMKAGNYYETKKMMLIR